MKKYDKGIMPSRSLAKLYFSLMAGGFACMFVFGIGDGTVCIYPGSNFDDPTLFCRVAEFAPVFFIVPVALAIGLLVADSFERGSFDDKQ